MVESDGRNHVFGSLHGRVRQPPNNGTVLVNDIGLITHTQIVDEMIPFPLGEFLVVLSVKACADPSTEFRVPSSAVA